MNTLFTLATLIVVMEFAVEGIKALLQNLTIWEKVKGFVIPIINILAMSCLVLGTNTTLLNSLGIVCVGFVDYLFTILITSQGSSTWHEFKKKFKETQEENEDYSYVNAIGFNTGEEETEEDEEIETNIKLGFR